MEVTMISCGVEISIAGGVEERKDGHALHLFFLFFVLFFFYFFLNHMRLFKVQRQHPPSPLTSSVSSSSSVSSTHPAIEISTPRDYHHFSKTPPPVMSSL